MQVIGHDDKRIQGRARYMCRDGLPARGDHLANRRQTRFTVDDIGKETGAIAGTDGQEVGAGLGVVIIAQPDRAPVMPVRIVSQGIAFL